MHWDYGWGMGFGWIFMILFWALVIMGIVFLIKLVSGREKGEKKEETALDILKKRYAKGEIGREEFEDKKKDLL
jgi:putative membrane protein